jgi:hypothetical protein
MTYREAMDRFGSDKPDLRFGMEIVDLAGVFAGTQFKVFARALEGGGVVKALNAKGLFQAPIKMVEEDWTGLAKEGGLGGLAYIRVQEDGTWKSPIVKFFTEEEKAGLQAALHIEPGDLVLFGADKAEKVLPVLGRIRLLAGAQAKAIPRGRIQVHVGDGFPAVRAQRGGPAGQRAPSLHGAQARGHSAAGRRAGEGARAGLRHRAQRHRAGRRQHPDSRPGLPGADVPDPGPARGRDPDRASAT